MEIKSGIYKCDSCGNTKEVSDKSQSYPPEWLTIEATTLIIINDLPNAREPFYLPLEKINNVNRTLNLCSKECLSKFLLSPQSNKVWNKSGVIDRVFNETRGVWELPPGGYKCVSCDKFERVRHRGNALTGIFPVGWVTIKSWNWSLNNQLSNARQPEKFGESCECSFCSEQCLLNYLFQEP